MAHEPFVDAKVVSEYLDVSLSWIYKASIYSDMPVQRIGRNLRFKISEVEEWVRNGE